MLCSIRGNNDPACHRGFMMNDQPASARRVPARASVRTSFPLVVGLLLASAAVRLPSGNHQKPTVLAAESAASIESVGATSPRLENPDLVCARCHEAIYRRYQATAMGLGSGLAAAALKADPAELSGFHHPPSGIDYRVSLRDGVPWMSFNRADKSGEPHLQGERQLEYFVGSGKHGRTYLYQQEGEWFELPINFYTRRNMWDMAPAFDDATSMPAVLPTDPNCLHCHATQVKAPLPTARNRFASVPFKQGGIGCSACHGDPAAHLASHGHGAIVNPDKLPIAQRDSACLQCHLEGDAVVYRPGRSLAQFHAGEDLADTAVYFIRASQQAGGGRAASQYEALLRSACKRASGDRLTCTTCHDPHFSPSEADRAQYFRARCLSCHTGPAMAAHHPEQPSCAQCHMPSRSTTDISHEQTTDHDIETRPVVRSLQPRSQGETLVPVGNTHAGDRDYGLAYAQLGTRGDLAAQKKALDLLGKAAAAGTNDAEVEVQLGYLRQVAGQAEAARTAYAAALKLNPYEPTALANLAVLDASSGRLSEAVQLLDRLVKADPSQTSAGLNLAFIVCGLGHPSQALKLVHHLEQFNPDDPQLQSFLREGEYAGQHCALR